MKTTDNNIRSAQDNPRDVRWGSETWPSDRYMEFLLSRGVKLPPMTKEQYYVAMDQKQKLAIKVHKLEKTLKEVDEAYTTVNQLLKSERFSDIEKLEFGRHQEGLGIIRDRLKKELDVARDEHIAVVKASVSTTHWLHEYGSAIKSYAQRTVSASTPPTRIRFGGATYALLASARSCLAAPELGPEYNIEVTIEDLDPEQVLSFHSGQWDPVYALGSRLNAYGKTLASEEELEALIDTIEQLITTIEDQSERMQADELLHNAYRLLGKV